MTVPRVSLLAAALSCASIVQGAVVNYCPPNGNGVCFGVAIPASSASSGSGNIYFSVTAPTSFSWVSIGTGTNMQNSNLFVVYQDGNGNMTLSPRRGTRHTTPTLDTSSTAADLTLLGGSGIVDGQMVANIRCSNCQTWSAGSMSLDSTSAGWVGGWKSGSSLATTDRNARIAQHDDTVSFNLDLTQATVSTDSNPFTAAEETGGSGETGGTGGSGTGSEGGSGTGTGTGSGSGSGSGSNSNSNGGGAVTQVGTSSGIPAGILTAHGVVMAVVFAALYPLGSIFMPLFGKWWAHAAWQMVAFVLMWVGFGTGYKAAKDRQMLFDNPHTVFGTVVVCLLAVQPVLGWVHHTHFMSTGSRGVVSYAHIWWGRILLALGVINGGVGLQMVGEKQALIIVYSVLSAILFAAWFAVKAFKFFGNKNDGNHKQLNSPTVEPIELPRRPYQKTRQDRYT